jgi:hypothetical protein
MFFSPFHALFHWFLIKKVANSGSETLQYATAIPLLFKSAIWLLVAEVSSSAILFHVALFLWAKGP